MSQNKFNCECGSVINVSSKNRHFKSKKHIKYQDEEIKKQCNFIKQLEEEIKPEHPLLLNKDLLLNKKDAYIIEIYGTFDAGWREKEYEGKYEHYESFGNFHFYFFYCESDRAKAWDTANWTKPNEFKQLIKGYPEWIKETIIRDGDN